MLQVLRLGVGGKWNSGKNDFSLEDIIANSRGL
jgi:hypothetical protein